MPELIDRLLLIDKLDQGQKMALDAKDFMSFYALVLFKVMLQKEPEIEPEVRHGRWIDNGEYAVCTECGGRSGTQYDGVEPIPLMTQFCPHCGARMGGGAGNG